jgi:hypothetical protein
MDWSAAERELVEEILREAEIYLQAQQSFALSADQRSSVMASLFTATAVGIVVGLMTLVSSEHAAGHIPIYLAGCLSVALLVVAASLCIWSARPISFGIAGNEPQSWYHDVRNPRELKLLLGEQAENDRRKITRNKRGSPPTQHASSGGPFSASRHPLWG